MIFNILKTAKQLLFNNTGTKLKATNVQDAIEEVDEVLSDFLITVGAVSASGAVSIGSYAVVDIPIKPTVPEGYKILCPCGYATNSNTSYAFNCYIDSNGVGHLGVKNMTGSTITVNPWMYFVLVRDI